MSAPLSLDPLSGAAAVREPPRSGIAVWHAFDGPAAQWRLLERQAPAHIFQSHLWASTWHRHVGRPRGIEPRIVVIHGDDGAPDCVLPFGIRKAMGGRLLEWIGGEHADYQGGLFSPRFLTETTPESFRQLWNAILARLGPVDAINLVRQPRRLGGFDNPFLALGHRDAPTGAYHTVVGDDFDTYYKAKRSSRSRHTDRSKQKKLAAAGEIRFVLTDSADAIARAVDVMLEQKAGRLAEMGAPNPFTPEGVPEYLKTYAAAAGPDHAVVARLDCGDEVVAVAYGLRKDERFYYYIHSMTLGPLNRFSPGKLLMYELMQWTIPRGVRIFDFTIGDEDYKNDWCEGQLPLFENVSALTLRGMANAGFTIAKNTAKRAIKSVPATRNAALLIRSRVFGSKRPT
jgi:CelD/BcsL family acetyltransferase involved in cellulose biosynthesis